MAVLIIRERTASPLNKIAFPKILIALNRSEIIVTIDRAIAIARTVPSSPRGVSLNIKKATYGTAIDLKIVQKIVVNIYRFCNLVFYILNSGIDLFNSICKKNCNYDQNQHRNTYVYKEPS